MHWLKTCECFALPHWPLLLQTVLKRLSCLFLMLFALWWTDHVLLFSYSFLSRGIRTELCRPFPPHGLLLHQQVKSPYHHYCKLLDIHISAVSFKAHIYCFCFCYLKTIITKLKKEELLTQLQSRVNQNTQSLQFVLWLPRGLLVAGYVWNTSSRWHLCQTPKPPLLASFDMEKQQLQSEPALKRWAPNSASDEEAQKFHSLYSQSASSS